VISLGEIEGFSSPTPKSPGGFFNCPFERSRELYKEISVLIMTYNRLLVTRGDFEFEDVFMFFCGKA